MKHKGIASIIILLIVVGILVIAGGVYILKQKSMKEEESIPSAISSTVPSQQSDLEEEQQDEQDTLETFGGVGIQIDRVNDRLVIVMILENSSAEKAGLKVGDQIIEIDGKSIDDLSVEKATELIRGEPNTEVVLTINRRNWEESKEFEIKRIAIALSPPISFVCVILKSNGIFRPKIPSSGILTPLFETGTRPGINLHAVDSKSRHIGVNYMTGEFEIQIPGVDVRMISGDADRGWICLPGSIKVQFYISSHNIEQWIKENPELASQMTDTTESYDIYARYIGDNDIYASETLSDQIINPGEYVIYEVEGVADRVSLSAAVRSNRPPK